MSPITTQAVPLEQAQRRVTGHSTHDLWLAGSAIALLLLGLVMVASSSVAIAERQMGEPLYYFSRQLLYAAVGLGLALLVLRVPVVFWQRGGVVLLALGFMLLILALVPGVGREVNGSMRWIGLGPFNLQSSEMVKLFMTVYLAGYLVRRSEEVRERFTGFVKPLLVLMAIVALLLLEPDYGATVVLFATVLGMLFLGGVPLVRFISWVLAAAGVMGLIVVLAPYRVERLTAFLDPWADPFDTGFQLTLALIAMGRGEWFGVGLGSSVQKLFYLPEAHTDFLFAVLGEELGFVGMCTVILLFTLILWRAFAVAARARAAGHPFSSYLAYGLGLSIGVQAYINIGVNMGVLPTKGLTLPLMSYGGSSMVANCMTVALLLRIDHELRAGSQVGAAREVPHG